MAFLKLLATATSLVALILGTGANATTDNAQLGRHASALTIIGEFADSMCSTIPLEGTGSALTLSGDAQAKLTGLLDKLVALGVDGAITYRQDDYQGLLQTDLVRAIKESTSCKLKIWNDLKDKLLPSDKNGTVTGTSNTGESREECVSFETYADDTEFGSNITIKDFIFQSHHRTGRLFVNQSGRIKVLQFMHEGLTIDFPKAASVVKIELADFHKPIKLDVLGGDDHMLMSKTIDKDNSTELLRVKRNSYSIHKIVLSGGGNEGGIESVCANLQR